MYHYQFLVWLTSSQKTKTPEADLENVYVCVHIYSRWEREQGMFASRALVAVVLTVETAVYLTISVSDRLKATLIVWLASINHFHYLGDATLVWKIPSTICITDVLNRQSY